ncbi:MAG: ExbD/TolR family protein [Thermaurantiacus tibetensis]|uniref:ExbD/TolR family protein n=1 Tax=Thermaurantiacus tibetensis TaxID=2759035 RepID=UPI00188E0B58|nr:biopolymer transporter ExbD [Thermaurantiacus tibetensis]
MRFRPERPKEALIDLTPLIDMVFILLVFFMLAGTFRATDAFPVTPPASASRIFGDEREAVILVRADGLVGLNGRVLSHPEMIRTIRALLQENPAALVQVKADGATEANVVIEVLEKLREAGAGYVVLLTKGAGLVETP